MDPLAHTLVGATLARSGLEKRSGYAAAALIVGANLPDVDGLTYFVSGDLGLFFRRGWTHGIPAILIWPFVLAGALVLLDRILGRGRARFWTLLGLSLLAVATHPSLDWLNNYGMRWLMPIDGRWFYGDSVFIVDPWIWLALGGALFLAGGRGAFYIIGWTMAAVLAAALVVTGVDQAVPGKILFLAGLAAFAVLRFSGRPSSAIGKERASQVALAGVAIYLTSLLAINYGARRFTLSELRARGIEVEALMVGPSPLTPFLKDVVAATALDYRYGTLSLWPRPRLDLAPETLPRIEASSAGQRALTQPEVKGFAIWARFPWAEVVEEPGGFRVTLRDARYVRASTDGFGTAVVFLPAKSLTGR